MKYLVLPDVEAAARTVLAGHLRVPVSVEWPRSLPREFALVTVTGGVDGDVTLATVDLLVECFAASTVRASEIARLAGARLRNVTEPWGPVHVQRCNVDAPVLYPDPRTQAHTRYQFTAEAVLIMEVQA